MDKLGFTESATSCFTNVKTTEGVSGFLEFINKLHVRSKHA